MPATNIGRLRAHAQHEQAADSVPTEKPVRITPQAKAPPRS